MKRFVLIVMLVALASAPAFAQWRLDVGVDIPRGVGAMFEGNVEVPQETIDFFNNYFFPFPEAALHYQMDLGLIRAGVGVRAFTLILETAIWPNAFAEVILGPVAIEAQVGGGLFGLIGLYNSIQTGALFFPDLSAWVLLGKQKNFRLGIGAMGFYLPEVTTEGMGLAYYIGGKFAVVFD